MLINLIHQLPGSQIVIPRLQSLCAQLPNYALKPVNCLPQRIQVTVIEKLLSGILKQALADDELAFLVDRWAHINITDVPYEFFISVSEQQTLMVTKQLNKAACVSFCGTTESLLQLMSRNIDPDTLFFQRKLLVTGDTELGLEIKNFLDDMNLAGLPEFVQSGLQKYHQLVQHLSDQE